MRRWFSLVPLIAAFGLLLPPSAAAQPAPIRRFMYMHVYTAETMHALRQRISQLDAVSPVYFTVEEDGEVSGRDRPEVSAIVKRAGVRLIPLVNNRPRYEKFSPVLMTPARRAKVIDRLVELVRDHDYDGLNIDFEALEPSDRAGLTAFMQELSAKLRPLGKLTTIAVAAKPRELTTGWAGAYDYAALGRVSDYVVLMTYAYHPASGPPGSTAPIDWVRRTAEYAASVVPPQKLLLGIGLWGYDWKLNSSEPAVVRTWAEIDAIAKRPGAQLGYSVEHESAWVRYTENGQERIIWFEDERAISAKLALIRVYRLAGWAAWRLGHEGPPAWNAFTAFDQGHQAAQALAEPARTAGTSAPRPNWDLPNGHFFTQTGELGRTGFAVTDDEGVPFYSEFRRLGGVEGVGFPRSHRFVWNGLISQVFQKAIFQWSPERGAVNLINVFDELSAAGRDGWLERERSTPRPLPAAFDAGRSWAEIQAARLALLDLDPALRQAYFRHPDPLHAFGLPTSRVEDRGNHTVIRLQRAVLQRWKVDVPWAKAGDITIANGGDIALEAGIIPAEAMTPRPAAVSPR
ncbi:MAG: glycosyl hydrolase family 18 protein [Chloroflexota bacterium]|nr:glycosyl hydrolase family 18 protein [Dehalococcoidia bacterium]MDW8254108.1 glycosyl hydrolase family 18 protein [Chloroflexota bacterium]